jgi:hypothetical protein
MVIPVQTTTACFLWLLDRFQERVTGVDISGRSPRTDFVAWAEDIPLKSGNVAGFFLRSMELE